MPLADLLAPQIKQKLNQIEVDLGRAGYLAHSGLATTMDAKAPGPQSPSTSGKMPAGYNQLGDEKIEKVRGETEAQAKKFDPRGALGRPKMPELYDPNSEGGMRLQARSALARVSPDAAVGFDRGVMPSGKTLIPNAPAAPQPTPDRRFLGNRQVVQLGAGPAGQSEGGQAVDRKGKKLGYLAGSGDPNLQTRAPDAMDPYHTGGAEIVKRLSGGAPVIDRRYRKHLEALEDNKFPDGYFEAIGKERGRAYSEAEREDIANGVAALRKMDKGVSI